MSAIAVFLYEVAAEGKRRGYKFDVGKIAGRPRRKQNIAETRGQLNYEWAHLKRKLKRRSRTVAFELCSIDKPVAHPLFRIVAGEVRKWEGKVQRDRRRLRKSSP